MNVLNILRKNKCVSFKTAFRDTCTTCRLAKSQRLPFELVEHRSTSPLELIHSDVWQSPTLSHQGFRYYVSFVDDFSRFTWIYPMKHKSEVYAIFCNFQTLMENLFHCKSSSFKVTGSGI